MIKLYFNNLDFIHLLPGLILLLFILVRLALQKVGWCRRKHLGHSLLHYFFDKLTPPSFWQAHSPGLLQTLSFLFLYLAFLDPVIPVSKTKLMSEGLDIALVLDLSTSMVDYIKSPTSTSINPLNQQATPFQGYQGQTALSRLDAIKAAALDFIKRRPHDRLGLIVFSMNAYVVSPTTTDHLNILRYISLVDNDTLIGEGMTSIGAGISTAIDLLKKQMHRESISIGLSDRWGPKEWGQGKIIVVFTDAEQNYGLDPLAILRKAKELGYRVYLIGLAPIEAQAINFWHRLIRAIQSTGGRYYDAQDTEQLKQAYLDIDSLEKAVFYTKQQVKNVPVYTTFAGIAFVLLALSLGLRTFRYFTRLD